MSDKNDNSVNPIKRLQDQQLEGKGLSSETKQQEEAQLESEVATVPLTPANNYPDQEAEYVPLSSKGIFYKGRFKGLDKLKVRKLNYTDEDILTTKSYYDDETLFNEVLRNVVVDTNGFKAEQLVPVDRDAILMWLRIGAFGREYSVPHVCEQKGCGKRSAREWDLAGFYAPVINPAYEKELVETGEVTFTLPKSGVIIKLTVPSTGREFEVKKMLDTEQKQLKTTRDHVVSGRLLSVISAVYIDGKEIRSLKEIQQWLKSGVGLSIPDSRFIQKKATEIDLKIDTAKDFTCKQCGHTEEGVALPMTIYFFWPEYTEV